MWDRTKAVLFLLIFPVLGVLTLVYMFSIILPIIDFIVRGDKSYVVELLWGGLDDLSY